MRKKSSFGAIRQERSGNYSVRFTDPQGKRQTVPGTFRRKSDADRKLLEIRAAVESNTWRVDQAVRPGDLDPKTLTLRELATHWRSQRVSRQGTPLSPTTLNEYQRLIESTLKPLAHRPIREITRQQIENWRTPELKRAPNQTVKAYKHLKTLMTWAHKRSWIAENPCDIERGSAYTPTEPPAPTRAQVQIVMESARYPFNVVIALAAFGGLRKGEILELRRKDVEVLKEGEERWIQISIARGVVWDGATAIVRKPKSDAGVRTLRLPLSESDLLIKHLAQVPIDPEALLFGKGVNGNKHWGEYDLNPLWREVRALAGFNGRFHSLRAYAATEFAKLNPTSQELMDRFGHRDIKTAMRYQRSTGRDAELLRRLG